jgi:hypothetical protein
MSLTKVTYSMINGAYANVLDYGASPSATAAVNTAAINAAIAANEIVYFPEGNYNINNSIAPGERNCTLIGAAPNMVTLTSSNAAADVILFYRAVGQNGYVTQVININTVGGLNGIHIYGGYCGVVGLIENVKISSAANAGLLIDSDPTDLSIGSTWIYGRVKNLRIELGLIGTGVKVVGYNMINATLWENVSVSGCATGLSITETVSTGIGVQFDTLVIEGTQAEAIQITGTQVLINNLYTEKIGFSVSTADINLNSDAATAAYRANLTLINPYWGPHWGASVSGTNRVSFRTNFCTVTIYGMPAVGTYTVDGNNRNAGAYIYLYGYAAGMGVVSFNNKELRYGGDSSTFTGTLTGVTTTVTSAIRYQKDGYAVTLTIPANLSGTSNATTKTITGMPAAFYPSTAVNGICLAADNGGAYVPAVFSIATNGVIDISANVNFGAWTASGTATILAFTITYVL